MTKEEFISKVKEIIKAGNEANAEPHPIDDHVWLTAYFMAKEMCEDFTYKDWAQAIINGLGPITTANWQEYWEEKYDCIADDEDEVYQAEEFEGLFAELRSFYRLS